MIFYRETVTKDGRKLILRNPVGTDAEAYYDYFRTSHAETDFLTTYPDEGNQDVFRAAERLDAKKDSTTDAEICAFVDGKLVGSAGIYLLRDRDKTRHRAEFGISILKEYWGLGIGSILTGICVDLAKAAGYLQLELEAVADNRRALRLYERFGFVEFGRNPKAFRTREGKWQETVLMRLDLSDGAPAKN